MAVWRRKLAPGLVHHSDQEGVQYTSLCFGQRLKEVGVTTPSMGRTGTALDNALPAGRKFRLDLEGGVGKQTKVSEQTGSEDGYLRLSGDVLQHSPPALSSGLQKSRRLRGG